MPKPPPTLGVIRRSLSFGSLEHEFGERIAHEMRALRRGIERRAAARRIVFGNGVARLHRIGDDAVVDEVERDDARGLGERGLGRLGVAHVVVPVEHHIAGDMVEQLRRAGRDRVFGIGHRRQRSYSTSIASAASRAAGKVSATTSATGWPTWRTLPSASTGRGVSCRGLPSRLVSGIVQGMSPSPSARTSSPVATNSTPGMRRAAVAIDALDVRMGHRRAQHEGLRHLRQHHVVGVAARPVISRKSS